MPPWSHLFLPCAVLLVTTCGSCTAGSPAKEQPVVVHANGRDIRVPAPPGMRFWRAEEGGYQHWFEPVVHRRAGPYYGRSSVRGLNEERPAVLLEEMKASFLEQAETEAVVQWRRALSGSFKGRTGPLPDAPEGVLHIECDTSSAGLVTGAALLRQGDARTFFGSALLLVNGRALSLDIWVRSPVSPAEIAAVRAQVDVWARLVQEANPEPR